MTKTQAALDLDQLQKLLRPLTKRWRFKVRGRTFNRTTEDGLTQVINLQLGASDPPGTTYIAGLRENLHGWFTVNLGVYVPEVARHHGGGEARAFVQPYDCCVRVRLGEIGPEAEDLWWEIACSPAVLEAIEERLSRDALPFFDRHASRGAILRACAEGEGALGNAGAPERIVAAVILSERGDQDGARALLARQAQERYNPQHPAYVRSLAQRLGSASCQSTTRETGPRIRLARIRLARIRLAAPRSERLSLLSLAAAVDAVVSGHEGATWT